MWQAGPWGSTRASSVSPSQSRRSSRTAMRCPLSSPLCQSFPRDRLKKTISPVSAVSFRASALAQATMSTVPDWASWTTTGTRPCGSKRSVSSPVSVRPMTDAPLFP
ncbi:MAG: hypothetical protein BWY88_01346 [Synergistetes bacterium ADurb.Bin520]|nr:MAG: hypothetical protein BWY88_01346 [Synergistetes bacterium ADurb.Bin520]